MKKLTAFMALAAVMTALTACGGDVSSPTDTVTSEQTGEEAVISEETQPTEQTSEITVTSVAISEMSEMTIAEEPPAADNTDNEYNDNSGEVSENEPQIRVEWADEAVLTADHDECDIFAPSEDQAKVAFTSDKPVNEFVILELTFTDCSDEGVMTFDAYPAASPDQTPDITPGKPLVIGFTFMGDIPEYGFQYEDAGGNLRRFAIEISGEDVSLVTREASMEYYDFVLE